ncbi:MAG: hypothetical protein WBQ43_14730 [Terriglobales bacterium]
MTQRTSEGINITVRRTVQRFNHEMNSRRVSQIAPELCDLLQLQLDSILGRKLTGFTCKELDAYKTRKSRIAVLRRQLRRLANPTPSSAIRPLESASGCSAGR